MHGGEAVDPSLTVGAPDLDAEVSATYCKNLTFVVLTSTPAFLYLEGPLAPIVSTTVSYPNGSHNEEPCKRFFRGKKERSSLRASASTPLAYDSRNGPAFSPAVRLRGITHKAESNSHCLGRETDVLVPVDIPTGLWFHCKGCVKSGLEMIAVFGVKKTCRQEWRHGTPGGVRHVGPTATRSADRTAPITQARPASRGRTRDGARGRSRGNRRRG